MSVINTTGGSSLSLSQQVEQTCFPQIYGSVEQADHYFGSKVVSEAWDDASPTEKMKGLAEATRLIDRFAYQGTKLDSEQYLEFPRDFHTEVPQEIQWACYEIAYKLLDGFDLQREMEKLGIKAHRFSGVAVEYNGSMPEYLMVGIPSFIAWSYLRPFLADVRQVNLFRIS